MQSSFGAQMNALESFVAIESFIQVLRTGDAEGLDVVTEVCPEWRNFVSKLEEDDVSCATDDPLFRDALASLLEGIIDSG